MAGKEAMQAQLVEPFGARVTGLNVFDDAHLREATDLLALHAMLIFPAHSAKLGTPPLHKEASMAKLAEIGGQVMSSHPLVETDPRGVTELRTKGNTNNNQDAKFFHADKTWHVAPSQVSVLSPTVVPSTGGETTFIQSHQLYLALPPDLRHRLHSLYALHSFTTTYHRTQSDIILRNEYEEETSAVHPAVIAHPITGCPLLFVNESSTLHFVDIPADESHHILTDVFRTAYGVAPQFKLQWKPFEVVIFDNIALQHRASDNYTELRVMRRVLGCNQAFRTRRYAVPDADGDGNTGERIQGVIQGENACANDVRRFFKQVDAFPGRAHYFETAAVACGYAPPRVVAYAVAARFLLHCKETRTETGGNNADVMRVLDVGAGTGLFAMELDKRGVLEHVKADYVDSWEGADMEARRRKWYHEMFSANIDGGIPVEEESYDYVVCADGLQREWVQARETLSEMRRVGKKKSVLVVAVEYGNEAVVKAVADCVEEGTVRLTKQEEFVGFSKIADSDMWILYMLEKI